MPHKNKPVKKKRVNNASTGRSYVNDTIRQATPSEKKRRAGRNAARRKMIKAGKVKVGSTLDVHHPNNDPANRKAKLRVISRSKNRGIK